MIDQGAATPAVGTAALGSHAASLGPDALRGGRARGSVRLCRPMGKQDALHVTRGGRAAAAGKSISALPTPMANVGPRGASSPEGPAPKWATRIPGAMPDTGAICSAFESLAASSMGHEPGAGQRSCSSTSNRWALRATLAKRCSRGSSRRCSAWSSATVSGVAPAHEALR